MEQPLLPPWTKKRRVITLALMTVFILIAAIFIGAGTYQVAQQYGLVKKSFSKQQIAQDLLNDSGFIRAVQKSALNRRCSNSDMGFEYDYQSPFAEVYGEGESLCTKLVTLHSTGADVIVEITKLNQSREVLAAEMSNQFERVDTSLMAGTVYPTSRLSGIREGIPTEIYIVGIDRQNAYTVSYAPTDVTLTGKVLGLIESFYSIPQ